MKLERAEAQATKIVAKLLKEEVERKDQRISELEEQLMKAAVVRTIKTAEQPGASPAALAAVVALEQGNTCPAEALLKVEEEVKADQIGTGRVDDAAQRKEAAALAREQGALAMGRDVRAALAAYQRAAEYEPDDGWTHIVIGDLSILTG